MKNYKSLYLICVVISLIVTASYSTTYANSTSVDERDKLILDSYMEQTTKKYKDGGFNIDSRISDKKQINRISEMMNLIDPSGRENVFIIEEDGSILSNKVSLLDDFKKQNSQYLNNDGKLKEPIAGFKDFNSADTGAYLTETNSAIASTGWKNAEAACPTAKTGPFRRATTAPGYSRMTAYIKLPTKNQGLNITAESYAEQGDKAYVYMGAMDKKPYHVDAGVAFNNESGYEYWKETWGMTMTGATKGSNTPNFGNFKSGWIVMKFYIPEKNKIVLEVTGINPQTNSADTVSVLANINLSTFKNFNANGDQVTLKRVTSIAQIENQENLNSGSTLGNSTDYVWWENVQIGTTASNLNVQTVGYFCGYKVNNLLVDYINQANEKIRVKAGILNP